MEVSLDDLARLDAFYVERQHRCVDELIEALRMTDGCLRVLYTGYNRSGKSTELFRLMRALQGEFVPVYISADNSFERSDIQHTDVLFALCMELARVAMANGLSVDPAIQKRMESWAPQVEGMVEEVETQETTTGAEAGVGFLAWIAQMKARFKVEHLTRQEIRKTLEPRGREITDTMAELATVYHAQLDRRPLLIVDDLEKSDRDIAEEIFGKRSASMLSVPCDVIYTIPVSLVNAPSMMAVQRAFDRVVVLPMIPVTDRDGNPDVEGIANIKSIVAKRASEDLFDPEALEQIALKSGGVVADALGLARECCLSAATQKVRQVTPAMVADPAEEMVLGYKRGLEERYYPILAKVALEREAEVDDESRDMIDALAILEYENKPNWYDVHPAVRTLLELRKDI
jgi:hypothetical protein